MKIKTGDTVKVITGHYKGTISEVKAVFPKTNKIVVEKEAPIDASNVMLYDKKSKSAERVGYKTNDKGEKVRVLKKSGIEVKEAKK